MRSVYQKVDWYMAIIGAVDACAITKDGVSGQKKNRVTSETDRK
ncbi:MAG: hypothetical protein ACLRK0_11375 [[Clostridium] scindens]